MRLAELVTYLDEYLDTASIGDWAAAHNGLQVENAGEVTRLAVAVDGSEAVVAAALRAGADLLIVHHGLFWGRTLPLTGRVYRKVSAMVTGNLAVYSSHLPLDIHAEVGNNPLLARAIGLMVESWWGETEGRLIGVAGTLDIPREELTTRLTRVLGSAPMLMPFGPARCHRVGIITGSAGSMIGDAAAAGCDTFITGEGQHHTFHDAEELGLNVYFGGHYATETLGVKALAEHLAARFGLPWSFIDRPTGL